MVSRRDFLMKTGLAALGSGLVHTSAQASLPEVATMDSAATPPCSRPADAPTTR